AAAEAGSRSVPLALRSRGTAAPRGASRPSSWRQCVAPTEAPRRPVRPSAAPGQQPLTGAAVGATQLQDHAAGPGARRREDPGRRGFARTACDGEIGKLLVLPRQLAVLDPTMQPRTRDPAREVAPIRRG